MFEKTKNKQKEGGVGLLLKVKQKWKQLTMYEVNKDNLKDVGRMVLGPIQMPILWWILNKGGFAMTS